MIYAGLDVSGESIVAVLKDGEGNTIHEAEYMNSETGLKTLVDILHECKVTVESSTSGLQVYEYLNSLGVLIVMANPSKIRLISESDKKTDKNDAEVLANLLRVNMLPTCYVPPKDVRKRRNLIRERKYLVQTNVRFKNRVRAILASEGIKCKYTDIFGKESQEWLSELKVSPDVKTRIEQILRIGTNLLSEIKILNREIEKEYNHLSQAYLLDTIPGIAENSAVTILSEIGNFKRFDSPKKLCSYAGLVPRVRQSGNTRHDGHIKAGNKLLRTTLVQNANIAVLHCKRFRKFYCKLKRKKGHQKAIIAVARKMLTIIWFMLQRNEPFDEAVICHRRRCAA